MVKTKVPPKALTLLQIERAIDLGRLGPLWITQTDLILEQVGLAMGPIRSQEPFEIINVNEYWAKQRDAYENRLHSKDHRLWFVQTWDEWIAKRGIFVHAARDWHQQLFDRTGKVHRRWWAKHATENFHDWFEREKKILESKGHQLFRQRPVPA